MKGLGQMTGVSALATSCTARDAPRQSEGACGVHGCRQLPTANSTPTPSMSAAYFHIGVEPDGAMNIAAARVAAAAAPGSAIDKYLGMKTLSPLSREKTNKLTG